MQNNWQNRMLNHEENPPKDAWENIVKLLDKADGKLDTNIAPVVSISNNTARNWKVAAAACVVAMVSATIWFNTNKTSITNNNLATVSNTEKTDKLIADNVVLTIVDTKPAVIENKSITKVTNGSEVAINNTPKTIVTTTQQNKSTIIDNTNNNLQTIESTQIADKGALASNPALNNNPEKISNPTGEVTNDISLLNTPNGYVSFVGPNGQEVKVSSKFSNLLGYMDGAAPEVQENLDKIISESDFWRAKFKNWRNKMASNNIAPSPSNFMNIIELSNLLSKESK